MIIECFQQNNHHVDNISAKMSALRGKVSELERAAAQRKAKLDENSAFLQFNWKADVVESWIGTTTPSFVFTVSFAGTPLTHLACTEHLTSICALTKLCIDVAYPLVR